MDYKQSGVDIDAADALVQAIKPITAATRRRGSIGNIGGFGAMFDPKAAGFSDPLIVTSTDGVGTKILIAIETWPDTIGIDLVAMCVNDLVVQGAEPLSFLDYFATGKLDTRITARVIKGIADGCVMAGCVLAGGETAEMPGLYADKEFDLAGFAMGAVERGNTLPRDIQPGDYIYGLESTGAHSNGYSLIRKIVKNWDAVTPFSKRTFTQEFLRPTRIYVKTILDLHSKALLKGVAHITGGGIIDNLPRILPDGLSADLCGWVIPPLFDWIRTEGQVSDDDMLRTFNCGIGMVLVIRPEDGVKVIDIAAQHGDKVVFLGTIGTAPQKINFISRPRSLFTGPACVI